MKFQEVNMHCKDPSINIDEDVVVYDFFHTLSETFSPISFALCWGKDSNMWLTVMVNTLTPITSSKKLLKEDAS